MLSYTTKTVVVHRLGRLLIPRLYNFGQLQYSIEKARMSPRKTRTFNQWQSMQKAKSNGKGEKKFFFPACQLERARVLGFLAKHLAAMKGNKGSKGISSDTHF